MESKRQERQQFRLSPKALEQRRLLNAEFLFIDGAMGGELTLQNFANIDQLTIGENGNPETTIDFTLSTGVWSGDMTDGITGIGTSTLSVDVSLTQLADLMISSSDAFNIQLGDIALSGGFTIDNGGTTQLGAISQMDSTSVSFDQVSFSDVNDVCLTNAGNDFSTVSFSNVVNVEVADVNDLNVGQVIASGLVQLASGDGDATVGDGLDGLLTLDGDVTGDTLLLQASEGVTQSSGTITVQQLFLGGNSATESTGTFDLQQANDIQQVAANLSGELNLESTNSILFNSGTFDSLCDNSSSNPDSENFTSLVVGGNLNVEAGGDIQQAAGTNLVVAGDTELTSGASITLEENANAFVGSVGLDSMVDSSLVNNGNIVLSASNVGSELTLVSVNGNITQSGNLIVNGPSTLSAAGMVCLTDTTNDFGDVVSVTASTIELVDTNDLTTGTLAAVNDVYLRSGASGSGALSLTGDVETSDSMGQVLLQSASGVTQTGIIDTNDLLLGGSGAALGTGFFNLNGNNVVNNLSADLDNAMTFVNSGDLVVSDLTYLSDCGTSESITGLNLVGNLIALNVDGSLTQSAAVVIAGTSMMMASSDICLTDPTNDFGDVVTAMANTIELVDSNALTTGLLTAVDDVYLRSGASGFGALTLTGDVSTSDAMGQVLLQSATGVTQTGIISTNDLLLGGSATDVGSGFFNLNANNIVNNLAVDLNDALTFVNTGDLLISDLTYSSDCGTNESIAGLTLGGNLVSLNVGGNLTQSAAVMVAGTAMITASSDICLTNLNNDFDDVVTATANTIELVDADSLATGLLTAVDDVFLRAGTSGFGALSLTDNVTTSDPTGQVLLQSATGVTQTGIIETNDLLLGGSGTDVGSGFFNLNASNLVNNIAADLDNALTFVNSGDLVVSDLTYSSDCGTSEAIVGINLGGNLVALNVDGSLIQTGAVVIAGTSMMTASLDICLTDTNNDFGDVVTATANTIELVDANALTTGLLSAVDDVYLRSGAGGFGALSLTDNVVTSDPAGQVLLQSATGVTQTGVINTNDLLLGGSGTDVGTGFFNLNANNVVNNLATDLDGTLTFVNAADLVISELTYASDCGTSEVITGLNLGGNLVALNVDGSLTQTAAVVVAGTSMMTASMDICLTDQTNDFGDVVTATAATIELVDANELATGAISAVNDVYLRSGAGGAGVLSLNGNVETSDSLGQVLLQSASGVTQTGVIVTNDLLLGGSGTALGAGFFNLNGDNVVNNLSADLDDALTFVNSVDLVISDLTYSSSCGTVQTITGLSIDGNLTELNVDGNLTQSAAVFVVGTSMLTASSDICLTNPTNDFGDIVTATADTIELVDANDLTTGILSAVNDVYLRSGAGGSGALSMTDNITTTDSLGQVLLQSASGVTQTGIITANDLLLGGSGVDVGAGFFNLNGNNNVNNLSADLDSALTFVNSGDLAIADLTYTSDCGASETITGLNVQGLLELNVAGDLSQSASVTAAMTTNIVATGHVCLTNTNNDFMDLVTANAATIGVVDQNDLATGVLLATEGVFLRSGAGGIGALNLAGSVTTTDTMGQVLLQSANGVTQTGIITTQHLMLGGDQVAEGSGQFVLDGNNQVSALSSNLANDLVFVNSMDLSIVKGSFECNLDLIEEFMGTVVQGDLTFNIQGSLYQNSSNGLMPAGALIVGGDTTITVTENICLLGVDCDGDGVQDNSFGGDINLSAGGEIAFATSGTLTITADLVDGGGNFQFIADIIEIETDIAADQLLLNANSSVSLGDAFVIDVVDLLLVGGGDFELVNDAGNQIQNIAAAIGGDLTLNNAESLTISRLVFTSECGDVAVDGLNVGGNLDFTVVGDLKQTEDAPVIVAGLSMLDVTGDIGLIGGDIDNDGLTNNDFESLQIVSATNAEVADTNDLIVVSATVTNGMATNQLWLQAGAADATPGDGADGAMTINGDIMVGGMNPGQALLQASEGITQDAMNSVITVDLLQLGGNDAIESTGLFDLQGNNVVDQLSAELLNSLIFTNAVDLTIVKSSYTSICDPMQSETFDGLVIGENATLNISGDLDQTDGVLDIGTTDTDLTMLDVSGDICLLGADCDGDGTVDMFNDFESLQIVSATNAEVADANDLIVVSATVTNGMATNQLWLQAGAADATPGDGADGAMTINGDIMVGGMNPGQALLQASEGITQDAMNSVITVDLLQLGGNDAIESTGLFDLQGNNVVDQLSAELLNSLIFTNAVDLTIVKSSYTSICDPMQSETFDGLVIGENATLNISGDLDQTDGVLDIGTDATDLTMLDVSGDICLLGADCDGDGTVDMFNDFESLQIVSATNAEIVDTNDLIVVSATVTNGMATNQLWLQAGAADATPGDGADGAMTINGDIMVGGMNPGQALLQASEGITQDAMNSVITVDLLQLGGNDAIESTGLFDLQGNNVVDQLSAELLNSLIFTNAVDLTIVKSSYTSICDPMQSETFDGLVIGENATLNISGDLDQTDGVLDIGTTDTDLTMLDVSGDICLLGADCDGDGTVDMFNDFESLQIVSATNAEVADANDLIVVSATVTNGMATNQLWLQAGAADATPGDGADGAMTINGDIMVGGMNPGQALLQASEGITQDAMNSVITVDLLQLGGNDAIESTGLFDLQGNNVVDQLSAELLNSLIFTNAVDLTIVKSSYTSICDPMQSETFDGLVIGENATLNISGDLDQTDGVLDIGTDATDLTMLDVSGDICLLGADCDGDGTVDMFNDFESLQIVSATNAEIVDANDLIVVSATVTNGMATNQLWLQAGAADATPGDGADGAMTINGDIMVGGMNPGQALLQASEGITQDAMNSVITVDLLQLGGNDAIESTGLFDLQGNNLVDQLSAELLNSLIFTNAVDLTIVKSSYTSICDPMQSETFDGLVIGENATLNITGDLDQTDGVLDIGTDATDLTMLDVSGDICLLGADCDGDGTVDMFNDFESLQIVSATNAEIVDANDLIVVSANVTNGMATNQLWLQAGAADATPGDGADGTMTINGDIMVGGMNPGQALLQASEGITQDAMNSVITVDLLQLGGNDAIESTGLFDLQGNNVVDQLSAELLNSLIFTNAVDLTIVKSSYTSICDPMQSETFDGLVIGENATLNISGDLDQTDGVLDIGTTDTDLTMLDVSGDICLLGADCDGDGTVDMFNDFESLQIVSATNAEVADANDLIVVSATVTNGMATNQLWLQAGAADATPGDGADGAMTINGDIMVGGMNPGQALLQASEGITQDAMNSVITVDLLQLGGNDAIESTGLFDLQGNNVVDQLSAELLNSLIFTNAVDLTIVKSSYTSICDPMQSETFDGLVIGENATLNISGDLDQTDGVLDIGTDATDLTMLDVSGDICLLGADCDGDGTVDMFNDFESLQIVSATNAEIVDANDLIVVSANVTNGMATNQLWLQAGAADATPGDGADGAMTINGDIMVGGMNPGQALLQASEGITQDAMNSVITVDLLQLGGNDAIESTGLFDLQGNNVVDQLSAELLNSLIFTNAVDLTIVKSSYTSICDPMQSETFDGLVIGENATLNISGDLDQTDGVLDIGTDATDLTMLDVSGDICLLGADCDGDGTVDMFNDFESLQIVSATNAEVADANDLIVVSANVTNGMATNQLWLQAGAADATPGDGADGTMTINGDIMVGGMNPGQALLQASEGITQDAMNSVITVDLLQLGGNDAIESTGLFDLQGNNLVDQLSAELLNSLIFTNAVDLTIVKSSYTSICDPMQSETFDGLVIGENATLNITGDLDQTDGVLDIGTTDTDLTMLDVSGDICLLGADCDGDGTVDMFNDFESLQIVSATNAEVADANDLIVVSANVTNGMATNQLWLQAGAADATPGDGADGAMTINGDIMVGGMNPGQALLQASEGITQDAMNSVITVDLLQLGGNDAIESTGLFDLQGNNVVDQLSAELLNSLIFTNAVDLTIVKSSYTSICDPMQSETFDGLVIGENATLNISGDLDQTDGVLDIGTDATDLTMLDVSGDICLLGADCDGDGTVDMFNDFESLQIVSATNAEIVDANDLIVVSANVTNGMATNQLWLQAGAADATPGDGADGAMTINGDIMVGGMNPGQALLQASEGITQDAMNSVITVDLLQLGGNDAIESTGLFDLQGNNVVDQLSAELLNSLIFTNAVDLTIVKSSYTSICDPMQSETFDGLVIGENATLNISGDLDQTDGVLDIGTDATDLTMLDVSGDICLLGADCDGDGTVDMFNDFESLQIVSATNAEVADANDLIVVSATVTNGMATNQLWLQSGAADATPGDGADGAMTINGDIMVGGMNPGQALLQASEGITQDAMNSVITVDLLQLGGNNAIESTGLFDLQGNNLVDQLSAELLNSLIFTNAVDLTIVKSSYTSICDPMQSETFDGLVIGENATLNISGDLDQTDGVLDIGTDATDLTMLDVSGDICLLGADCDGDGTVDMFNDFESLQIVSATNAEIVDANDLIVVSANVTNGMATNQLWLQAGAADATPGDGADGAMTINGDIMVGGMNPGQALLQASEGITQDAMNSVITVDLLQLGGNDAIESTGLFDLQGNNLVDQLSAELLNSLIFTNAVDLTIVKSSYTSICDPMQSETFDGLVIGENATLNISGDLDQTDGVLDIGTTDTDLTMLDVSGDICLLGADCDGDGTVDMFNDFESLQIVSATNAEIVDANDLIVVSANVTNGMATNQLWLQSGAADATPGDGSDGVMTINGDIMVGGMNPGQALLQASEGITQDAMNSVITVDLLQLGGNDAIESTGLFDLQGNNLVDQLSAELLNSLIFTNAVDLTIVKSSYTSICDPMQSETFDGLVIGENATLNISGDLDQTDGVLDIGTDATDLTMLDVSGDICLLGADCDGDGTVDMFNDFESLQIVSATNAEVADANDLIVVSANVTNGMATNQLWLQAGAADATPGDGADGAMTINGDIMVGGMNPGQALLQASEGITQDAMNSVITVDLLQLGGNDAIESTGLFDLQGNNVVDQLSAELLNSLIFTNAVDLTIVKSSYTSICDPMQSETFDGLVIGENATLNISGDLDQTDGVLDIGTDATDLTMLDVSGDICLLGADCDGDGTVDMFNDFESLQIVSATNAEVADANDLIVVSATVTNGMATNQLWLQSGAADATPGDGADGAMTINGDIMVGGMNPGQALLQASEGITQDAMNSVITVDLLQLGGNNAIESTGLFDLQGNNLVDQLSAELLNSLIFTNAVDLTIVKSSYTSICDPMQSETFDGLVIGENATLNISGDLDQTDGVLDIGTTDTDLTMLDVSGDICLLGADCDGDGTVDMFNDFESLQIVNATNAEVADANDLIVVSANVTNGMATNQLWLQAGAADATPGDGADGALTINGDIMVGGMNPGQALLQASEGITQDAMNSVITVDLLQLGGNDAIESTGLFDLQGNNLVDQLSAELLNSLIFTNAVDLTIVKSSYTSICDPMQSETFDGLVIGENATLNISGDLDQTDGVLDIGTTDTDLTMLDVSGDICLLGADCDGDGTVDMFNDFESLQIVIATNAEVADANDLIVVSATVTNGMATNQLWLQAGAADATPGDGADGAMTINGDIMVGGMNPGQALLQASEGITQDAMNSVITVDLLQLGGNDAIESTGLFDLQGNNLVDQLSAELLNSLIFTNAVDLTIVKSSYTSICDPMQSETFDGLVIGENATLNISGDLDQTDGVLDIGTDATDLTMLDVSGDICLLGADCDGDGTVDMFNDFESLQIVSATNAEVADANDLIVVSANVTNGMATNQLWLQAGAADATPGDGVDGTMTINGDIMVGGMNPGQALLQASEGVAQMGGIIDTNLLFLGGDQLNESSGDFILGQLNEIDQIAGQLTNSLQLLNTIDLTVAKATYVSVCDPLRSEAFNGLEIGGDLTVTVNGGSLDQTAEAPVMVQGHTRFTVFTGNICLTGGDCDADGNTNNDFNTLEIVSATNAEILDANDLTVTAASVASQLWLAAGNADAMPDNPLVGSGQMTLQGNLSAAQILLQASEGIDQQSGNITTSQLLLGGDEAKEGSGDFILRSSGNSIADLAAELGHGTLQLANARPLRVINLQYVSACSTDPSGDSLIIESLMRLYVGGEGAELDGNLLSRLEDLSGTAQAMDIMIDLDGDGIQENVTFNGNFSEYLTGLGQTGTGTPSDIGVAIFNTGDFLNVVEITAAQSDILVQTEGTSSLNIGPFAPNVMIPFDPDMNPATPNDANVTVVNPDNHILLIAGGNLELQSDLVRGAGDGVVSDELNINPGFSTDVNMDGEFDLLDLYFLVLDPGFISDVNAVVDTTNLTQQFELIFGSAGESNFDFTVFWGIEGIAEAGADPFFTSGIFAEYINLLNNGFESQSFYIDATDDLLNAIAQDPSFGNTVYELLSLPINAGSGEPDSFTIEFLRDNSEFLNVLMVFNDANINIFQNAGTGLEDLNVAAEEFTGLARIGEPPQVVVDLPEFIVPTRIDVSPTFETQTFQAQFTVEETSFVPTVNDKFFIVVYFENQADADYFQEQFGDEERDYSDTEIDELLLDSDSDDKGFFNSLRWAEDTEDVNKIREILENAGLDLEDDDQDLLKKVRTWLKDADNDTKTLKVPRGIFKIIVVEDNKALIQGDDVDRRFVPEPIEEDDQKDFKLDDKKDFEYLDEDDQSSTVDPDRQQFVSHRLSRWNAILSGENMTPASWDASIGEIEAETESSTSGEGSESLVVATASAGAASLLSVLRKQRQDSKDDQSELIKELESRKSQNPKRNLFSSASRFVRRFMR